jgi:cysteinyl-tRNA synthetase
LLAIFNTLTRTIEEFRPREYGKVKMFTCGPSTYRRPHIGNYRTFLLEDLLLRYLEYVGYEVVRLISLTDIEDKAFDEAARRGVSVENLARENMRIFSDESRFLSMRSPTYKACVMACSSTAVDEAAQLIKALLQRGVAYFHKHRGRRNIYFDPLKFADFGKLSKLDMRRWPKKKRRFHKDNYPGTPWNKGDFILWHGCKEGDTNYWSTEIGCGRPAWNVQDAASIAKYLGLSIDLACGGEDNLVRHHDYTVSIIESISGENLANYWFHVAHLFADGKKMAKRRGNVYYVDDLVQMGCTGKQIRFFLICGYYRKRLNFTIEKVKQAGLKLDTLRDMVRRIGEDKLESVRSRAKKLSESILTDFEKAMNNDLNTQEAFDSIFQAVSKLDALRERGKLGAKDAAQALENLRKVDEVLKVIF